MNTQRTSRELRAIAGKDERVDEQNEQSEPEMCLYRNRTTALLRRYCRLSMELGRVPSLLGREFFRSKVTSYRMHNFEDVVIFVHDVERCLEQLDDFSQQLIARLALQEYSAEEAARLLGCSARTVERRYPDALDRITSILLAMELLEPMKTQSEPEETEVRPKKPSICSGSGKKPVARVEACQEEEPAQFVLSLSICGR